jgi:ribosomal protein S18 acetylase RimI-like enzyme
MTPRPSSCLPKPRVSRVGYAFVTIGPGYASWDTGDRLAELETLSVLPWHRGDGIGSALLDVVWARLSESGVRDLVITTAETNIDSRRFYERHGFKSSFVIYYGTQPQSSRQG